MTADKDDHRADHMTNAHTPIQPMLTPVCSTR